MAARKQPTRKAAARKSPARASESSGGGLWAPKLGIVALRLFAGLVFLAVAHHKLIAPLEETLPDGRVIESELSLNDRIVTFAELDLIVRVDAAIEKPPHIFGWELRWFSDALEATVRPGKAPYVFAAIIMFFEALVGISLVLGLATRLMAFLGALLMLVFGLAKALPFLTVTQGTNWYLVMILFALSLTAAGRIYGLDARLRQRLPGWIG
ncbi:MAG: DoxX family protein [Planctomycetota bacterium]|nr:DoxX family protein [Planctomycetota bacterium]